MDFIKESKKISLVCDELFKRELEARQKEHEKFMELSELDKKVYLAEQKYKDKIRKEEEKRIYGSKHYKKLSKM